MSDTKIAHTDGPWVVDGDDNFAKVIASDGWTIAETDHMHAGDDPGNWDVHLANMQLISAAPDMLAALELAAGLEPYLDPASFDGHAAHALKAIAAAIRKARGG